jgi:hypothetical protein
MIDHDAGVYDGHHNTFAAPGFASRSSFGIDPQSSPLITLDVLSSRRCKARSRRSGRDVEPVPTDFRARDT